MPAAERARDLRGPRERQEASGGGNAGTFHEHGAVVQRRRGMKETLEEIARGDGFERNAELGVLAEERGNEDSPESVWSGVRCP